LAPNGASVMNYNKASLHKNRQFKVMLRVLKYRD